jgi:hypothetical protein
VLSSVFVAVRVSDGCVSCCNSRVNVSLSIARPFLIVDRVPQLNVRHFNSQNSQSRLVDADRCDVSAVSRSRFSRFRETDSSWKNSSFRVL